MAGLINSRMAMPEGPEGDGNEARAKLAQVKDPGNAAGGSPIDQAGAEGDDIEFDDAIERVLTAAVIGMKQPQMVEQLRALGARPDPQAIADMAMTIVDALDEKSGATIPEDVLPGAALGVAAIIGDVIGAPRPVISQAGQIMLLRLLESEGVDPQQMQQVLSHVDINAMVEKAMAQMG